MTSTVEWVLKVNYLSIYLSIYLSLKASRLIDSLISSFLSFVQYCVDNNCMVDRHLDRCDEDVTLQRLRQHLEALDMNLDVPVPSSELALGDRHHWCQSA